MDKQLHCMKCGTEMTKGFVHEVPAHGPSVSTWVEGAVEKSLWTGVKYVKRQRMPVETYCCLTCGYIESYADLAKVKH
jgi:hypothetical protein